MIFTHYFRVLAGVSGLAFASIFLASNANGANDATASFSSTLSLSDYDAAGLAKLSPAERARLDALVAAYVSGGKQSSATASTGAVPPPAAANATVPQAAAEVTAKEAATASAPKAKKVKVDPGTEIEYNELDSEIVGMFSGFEQGTIFTLANGQRWKVTDGSYICGPDPKVRKVRVKPGFLGSFFLEFERVNVRPKVKLLK